MNLRQLTLKQLYELEEKSLINMNNPLTQDIKTLKEIQEIKLEKIKPNKLKSYIGFTRNYSI